MKNNKKKILFGFIFAFIMSFTAGIILLSNVNNDNKQVYAVSPSSWQAMWQYWQWNGYNIPSGLYVWSDGTNYYYSASSNQYVLDVSTSTWSQKTWTGLTAFYGNGIWSDGTNYYYSSGSTQYVLDVSTSTWSQKTWTGLTNLSGLYVWSDGTNCYYSSGSNQYVLDVSTSTWSQKTWTGLTNFNGNNVWFDGANYYYSSGSNQYFLDVSTSTWSQKTWTGLTNFNGEYVVVIDNYIFYINNSNQYVLDVSTSTWSVYTWSFDGNLSLVNGGSFQGNQIYFIDGVAYFYSGNFSGIMTLRLVMSNQNGGGDEPVYSFNGNNIDVATSLYFQTVGGNLDHSDSGLISFISCKFDFDYDDVNDEFKILFDLDYLRNYTDSNNVFGYSQSASSFDWFGYNTITLTAGTIFTFDSTLFGSSDNFYAMDSNIYNDLNLGSGSVNYRNIIDFNIYVSSGFTSYNFTGVRFFSDYVLSGNYYNINNHVRYFDANDEYIDISLPIVSRTLSDAFILSNRYYYFNQSQSGGSNSQAYDNGYAAGLQDGSTNGYNEGYTAGQSAGYNAGVDYANDTLVPNAYANGYAAGHTAGVNDANDYTFFGLISSVIDAPIQYMTSLFNFNVLGVNLLAFITGILTLCVVLILIKHII